MKRIVGLLSALLLFVSVVSASALTVTFSWTPNTESDLAGYELHYGEASGGPYNLLAEIGLISEYMWKVPANTDKTFYFVLLAKDQAGNKSSFSNEISARIDNILPGTPQNLIIIELGTNTLVIIPNNP